MADDLSHFTDEELSAAAGMAPAQQAAPVGGSLHQFTDEELHAAAGGGEIPKPAEKLPEGAWRAPSGNIMPEPGFQDAVMAQIPFAGDLAGAADAGVKKAGSLFTGKPTDFGADYESGRKDFWAQNERYKQDHPILDKVAQVTGTVAGMGSAPAAAPVEAGAEQAINAAAPVGGSLLARSARSAAVAAPIGAAYGFGTSDRNLEGRLGDAALGGLTGGLAGAAVPAVTQGAGMLFDKVANRIGMASPEAVANSSVYKALVGRDSLVPEALQQTLAQFPDKPVTVADLAGDKNSATMRLARSVLDRPGEGSATVNKILSERDLGTPVNGPYDMFTQGGAADRITGDIKTALGSDDAFKTSQDLLAQRSTASAPLYQKAFDVGPKWTPRLQQFLNDPVMRSGLNKGIQIQRLESVADGVPFDPKAYGITGFNEAGDPIISGTPNMRLLDAGKRGLDAIIGENRNDLTGKLSDFGRAVNRFRGSYVNHLDELNPHYAAARSAFSGPSASLDALNLGQKIFTTAPDQIPGALSSLSPENQNMFRIGVQKALIGKVQNTTDGANEVRALFGKPSLRNAISAAFEDPAALKKLSQSLGIENRMVQTNQLGAGSRTLPSAMDQHDLAGEMIHATGNAASHGVGHNPIGAAMQFVTPFIKRIGSGINEEASSRIANMLLNPEQAGPTLQMLQSLPADTQRQLLAKALMVTPAVTRASGISAGEAQ